MSRASIRIHDDGCGRLHLRWWADDSELWRDILASFKSRFPAHHDRSFSAQTKTWSVPRSHDGRLAEWCDDWFDVDAQQWDEEQPAGYGRTYSGSRGYGRYREPQMSTSTIEAAFATLHLLPSAPAWAAEAVYQAAIKAHHPDRGGDTQVMTRINLAMQLIRAQTEEKAS
jgi:hypothetical protein